MDASQHETVTHSIATCNGILDALHSLGLGGSGLKLGEEHEQMLAGEHAAGLPGSRGHGLLLGWLHGVA